MSLQSYYDEHASQARQHEGQRERMTSILLGVAGLLVGLVTYSKLSPWALPAAITVSLLGIYGYLFAGKHYERFRYHTSIMKQIRDEIDRRLAAPNVTHVSMSTLRSDGERRHYKKFKWPRFKGTRSPRQAKARSWIARQHLHSFWEAVHILLFLIGLSLTCVIVVDSRFPESDEPIKVQIVS